MSGIFPLIRPMNPAEGERLMRKILQALFDKTKELGSRQQSDLETNLFQYTSP